MRRERIAGLLLAIGVSLACSLPNVGALAQDYPTRRIKFVVPHPAGAQVDVIARLFANRLSEMWGQPIFIENKVGANGNLGAEEVARSSPDGYTLMFSTHGPLAVNAALFKTLDYDPQHDFDFVSVICKTSTLISAGPNFGAKSIGDVIALAKKEPGKLSMGTGGYGTGGHFTLVELNEAAGINIVHIPYRGSVQANTDLAAGAVPLVASDATSMVPLIRGGKIRPLAAAGSQRLAVLPEVPTVAEAAIPGFDISIWVAVSAPRGTPPQIVNKLNSAINSIMKEAPSRQRIVEQACNPTDSWTPATTTEFIRNEVVRWTKLVHDANVKIQ